MQVFARAREVAGRISTACKKLVEGQPDILGDLAQQDRRNVTPLMEWNGGAPAVGMTKLFVRTALTNLDKPKRNQNGNDLRRLQDRDVSHPSSDCDILNSDELGFEYRLAILEKHRNDFLEIAIELIERLALRMGAGKPGHESDKQLGPGTLLDHRRKNSHISLRFLPAGAIIGREEINGNLTVPALSRKQSIRCREMGIQRNDGMPKFVHRISRLTTNLSGLSTIIWGDYQVTSGITSHLTKLTVPSTNWIRFFALPV